MNTTTSAFAVMRILAAWPFLATPLGCGARAQALGPKAAANSTPPEAVEAMPAPLKTLERMKLASVEPGQSWVRGIHAIHWVFEGELALAAAYDLLTQKTQPGMSVAGGGRNAQSAWVFVDGKGYLLTISLTPGLRRSDLHRGITEILRPRSAVTADVWAYPNATGPMPQRWWRRATSAGPPTKLIPMPIDQSVLPAAVEPTTTACDDPLRDGFRFSAVLDRPCASVLQEAKGKLAGMGYLPHVLHIGAAGARGGIRIEQDPRMPFAADGFANADKQVYWITVAPEVDPVTRGTTNRTVVSWYWSAKTGPIP